MYDLVIFDCDGVLVDSEPLACRVLQEHLAHLGLPLSFQEVFDQFVGGSWPDTVLEIERRTGGPIPTGWDDGFVAQLQSTFERELRPVSGIPELLAQLRVPSCVASNSRTDELRVSLSVAGLLPHFGENVFSAAQVACGKPAPHLFLYAAATMGVDPSRCVVIEDTPTGVRGAVAAGMDVWGYTATVGPERLRDAGARVFRDMRELPSLLGLPGMGTIAPAGPGL